MPTIAMKDRGTLMRSVNVAELKNRLSKYLTFAKGGEEITAGGKGTSFATGSRVPSS